MDVGVEAGLATFVYTFQGAGLLQSLIDGLVRWILRQNVLDADLSRFIYTKERSQKRKYSLPSKHRQLVESRA